MQVELYISSVPSSAKEKKFNHAIPSPSASRYLLIPTSVQVHFRILDIILKVKMAFFIDYPPIYRDWTY